MSLFLPHLPLLPSLVNKFIRFQSYACTKPKPGIRGRREEGRGKGGWGFLSSAHSRGHSVLSNLYAIWICVLRNLIWINCLIIPFFFGWGPTRPPEVTTNLPVLGHLLLLNVNVITQFSEGGRNLPNVSDMQEIMQDIQNIPGEAKCGSRWREERAKKIREVRSQWQRRQPHD